MTEQQGEPIDRVATLLDHANDATDIMQFSEASAGTVGKWVYLPPRVELPEVRAVGIEEYAAQHFGGGKYKAGLRTRGTGAYGKSVIFEVGGPPKTAAERAAIAKPAESAAPIVPPANREPPNWVTNMLVPIGVTFATAAGTFLAKKILETPQSDPLVVELVRNMSRGGRGDGPAAPAVDPMAMMLQVLEFQDRLEERMDQRRGNAAPESLGAVIGQNVPQLLRVVQRNLDLRERELVRVQTEPAAPAATTSTTEPTSAPAGAPPTSTDPLAQLLGAMPLSHRQFLLDAATEGETPELYAELVLGKLAPAVYEQFAAQLARPDFLDVLISVVPAYAAQRAWFVQLVDAMRVSVRVVETPADGDGREAAPPSSVET